MDEKLKQLDGEVMRLCEPIFKEIEAVADRNRERVLDAFIENRVGAAMFAGSTGYGYGDSGRDALDRLFADIVLAEDALCRAQLLSGTHALTVALFGVLRPNDTLVSAMAEPYDTLKGVIGGEGVGSLAEFGVGYKECPLRDGRCDLNGLFELAKTASAVLVQRSRGYAERQALTVEDIGEICAFIKGANPRAVIIVDNCYGEFVEEREPLSVGADLIVGSLIKNAGGAVAPCGGYIAGKANLVELCANRMTAPGTGRELGCVLSGLRELYEGLYFAPSVVEQALKTAVYAACLFERLSLAVSPRYGEKRGDIVTAITIGDEKRLIDFCGAIQQNSPVDSFAAPEPWDMPGYDCKVIMAAGGFTNGSSIELSCDAPLRAPYTAYLQGGVHLTYSKRALLAAAKVVIK